MGLSQIRAGKFSKNCSKFNIRQAIKEVVDIQEQAAMQKNVKLEVSFRGFPQQNQDTSQIHSGVP